MDYHIQVPTQKQPLDVDACIVYHQVTKPLFNQDITFPDSLWPCTCFELHWLVRTRIKSVRTSKEYLYIIDKELNLYAETIYDNKQKAYSR
jgi:hypothetical protein